MQQQQGPTILSFLVDSINNFQASSQNLEAELLSNIATLINESYGSTDNKYRLMKDGELTTLKRSMDWKKYVLNLFQIVQFSENLSAENLERVLIENIQFITKESNYGAINIEEYIILIAANISCLTNINISAQIKKRHLTNIFDKLLSLDLTGKSIFLNYLVLIHTLRSSKVRN